MNLFVLKLSTLPGAYFDSYRFMMIFNFRNIQFFDLESQRKVTGSYVVVIGLGGVGSHAASMLLRSGVGKLLLVDFDQVSWVIRSASHNFTYKI